MTKVQVIKIQLIKIDERVLQVHELRQMSPLDEYVGWEDQRCEKCFRPLLHRHLARWSILPDVYGTMTARSLLFLRLMTRTGCSWMV